MTNFAKFSLFLLLVFPLLFWLKSKDWYSRSLRISSFVLFSFRHLFSKLAPNRQIYKNFKRTLLMTLLINLPFLRAKLSSSYLLHTLILFGIPLQEFDIRLHRNLHILLSKLQTLYKHCFLKYPSNLKPSSRSKDLQSWHQTQTFLECSIWASRF